MTFVAEGGCAGEYVGSIKGVWGGADGVWARRDAIGREGPSQHI